MTETASSRQTLGETELKAGALGLGSVVMQSIAHIAPAIAILFTVQFNTSLTGVAAPLSYLVAFLIVLVLGIVLGELARHLPSAGGYYTYVSRAVHPRAGFWASWMFILYSPLVAAPVLTAIGSVVETTLQARFGVTFPWWLFLVLGVALATWVIYRGIELSARTVVIFATAEMAIVGLLAVWGVLFPGPGGVNAAPFLPGNVSSGNGFFLAVMFSIFAFTGWEAAAAVAEESRDPRRNIRLGILGSIFILGAFLVLSSWGILIGWGTDDVQSLIDSPQLPGLVLAQRVWGTVGELVILLALINSAIAGSIAYLTVGTRMWFAMARSGSLPKPLAKVHPVHRTPVNAAILEAVLNLAVGLGLGFAIGPFAAFVFFGIAITFTMVPVYILGNLGAFLFFRRERPQDFNIVLHGILPLVGIIAVVGVGWVSINPPPAPPNDLAVALVVVWAILGVAILVAMRVARREEWLLKAGQVAAEVPLDE